MKKKDLSIALVLLLLGVTITLFAPYFLTRYSWLDLTQTGQIGDTIGGITSPITNLVGAALVFYALKAQIESNELTREQFQKQEDDEVRRKTFSYLSEQVNIIRSEINEFGFVHQEAGSDVPVFYKGASSIEKLANTLPDIISYAQKIGADPFKYFPLLQSITLLLSSILALIEAINNSDLSQTDKQYLISILSYQYSSKIKTAFESKLEKYLSMDFHFNLTNETTESVFTEKLFGILSQINSKLGLE